jgi:hypothetical protein
MKFFSETKTIWKNHNTKIILVALLAIFLAYSLLIALQLNKGLIPDEPAHFTFSNHFSTTLGIPPDTYETYSWGWYIEQNPFLFYWLNGRVINLINLVYPSVTDFELLIACALLAFFILYAWSFSLTSFQKRSSNINGGNCCLFSYLRTHLCLSLSLEVSIMTI